MYEIGATLRETRMRARIDISEVETATKIRAKYLRALENEEWGLLPGPSYIKSFLRTYADFLELDARLLLDEYKLRYEQPGESEFLPITTLGRERAAQKKLLQIPRGVVVAIALVGLATVLFILGSVGNDTTDNTMPTDVGRTVKTQPSLTTKAAGSTSASNTPKRNRVTRLRVIPTGPVWVCLENADGKRLIPGEVIQPAGQLKAFRSKRFKITLGNGQAELQVNGAKRTVPDRSEAVGYEITSTGRKELAADERPTCE